MSVLNPFSLFGLLRMSWRCIGHPGGATVVVDHVPDPPCPCDLVLPLLEQMSVHFACGE